MRLPLVLLLIAGVLGNLALILLILALVLLVVACVLLIRSLFGCRRAGHARGRGTRRTARFLLLLSLLRGLGALLHGALRRLHRLLHQLAEAAALTATSLAAAQTARRLLRHLRQLAELSGELPERAADLAHRLTRGFIAHVIGGLGRTDLAGERVLLGRE